MPWAEMHELKLKYGAGSVRLRLPERALLGAWSLASVPVKRPKSRDELLRNALGQLSNAGFEAALQGRRLGLLLADGTRAWDPDLLLSALAPMLGGAASIEAILCTGTHDPDQAQHRRMGERVMAQLSSLRPATRLHIHGAERHQHRNLGRTTRGTQVEIWDMADSCDLFLVLSDMKHHYFAGYSNPLKYFLPGIASLESARGNHSLAMEPDARLGRHPWHPDASRRGNPLAEDMLEAFELCVGEREHFALTSITGGASASELRWAGAGRTQDASARGIEAVDELASLSIPPARFLVVSAGGAPHDESLYTVQRALEMSRQGVREGGEVLLLAACANGIGSPLAVRNFFEPLCAPLDQISAPSRADYALYSHKPVKFARLIQRLSRLHLHSQLSRETVQRMHLHACADPQALVDEWVARLFPGEGIGFLEDASKLAIR